MKKIVSSIALAVLATGVYAQTKTLEQRIEELELSKDLSWVKVGGSLETRYDYVDYSRGKAYTDNKTAVTKGGRNDQYYRIWANLNIDARPTDRLSFFGRLSMAKYMNTYGAAGSPDTSATASLSEGIQPRNSALFMERAFFNYAISDRYTFTAGRLPTVDGPNKHMALNQQLMGNYPSLAYSAILDGFALTRTDKLDESSILRTKLIYTPTQTVSYNAGQQKIVDSAGNKVDTVGNGQYSVLMEYEKANGSWFEKNLSVLQFLHSNSAIYSETTSNNVTSPDSNLNVNVNRLTGYTEFQKVTNTNFDFAVQGMFSKFKSSGGFTTGATTKAGWLTDGSTQEKDGYAYVVTARYQLPFAALNKPKIGAEFFQSSKYAYLYDLANVNPINMYQSTDSKVYHLFLNYTIDMNLFLNTGYFYRQQDSTAAIVGLLGKPQSVDNTDQNIYVSLLATF